MAHRTAGLMLLLLAFAGCSLPGKQVVAASAVGDTCVVGTWTLVNETNHNGYSYGGNPVSVTGLAGSTLSITSSGEEKETFQGSQPLVGTLPDTTQLAITIGGSFAYRIHFASGKYAETGSKVTLPTSATVNGQSVQYQSSYLPGTGTYTCSSSSLTMTTNDENQTDQWSKG